MQTPTNHGVDQYRDGQSAVASDLRDVKTECQGMKSGFAEQIDAMRIDVLRVIKESQDPIHESDSSGDYSLGAISRKIDEMQSAVADVPIHHRILRHLVFDSMSARQSQIYAAEPDTCGWILNDDLSDNYSDDSSSAYSDASSSDFSGSSMEDLEFRDRNFTKLEPSRIEEEKSNRRQTCQQVLDWLQAGDSVLYISGNAGSGKSTLMKFLHGHRRTKEELLTWAGSKKLTIGHFFFWSAGNTPQRTLAGLYKSLLFQALSQCPELMEHVFPSQLARMKSCRGSRQVEAVEDFSDDHIEKAFDLLIRRTSYNKHRFCFFIDGLDECDGSRLDHERLAVRLNSWTTGGDVKLCVSSRPWAEFSKTFQSINSLTLHLHLLNRLDIETYCVGQLMKDDEAGQDPSLCRSLAETIVSSASGIFLWAHLVTDVVLQGIRQGDPAAILTAKIHEMPHQLKDLYKRLRNPVGQSKLDKERSDKMLLLAVKHVPRRVPGLNAMTFSWLDRTDEQLGLDNFAFPPASENHPYSEDEIARRLKGVAQMVNGLARGFLELAKVGRPPPGQDLGLIESFWSTRILFCHRSARDYLLEEVHDTLKPDFPNFDSVYERIHIAEYIYGRNLGTRFPDDVFWVIMAPPGLRDAGPELLGRLAFALLPDIEPYWANLNQRRVPLGQGLVSFLHYVAFWGCYKVCRASLDRGEHTCSPASVNLAERCSKTSLLVAAIAGCYRIQESDLEFLLELLNRQVELDVLVDTILDRVPMKLPAWLIVYLMAAQELLPNFDAHFSDDFVVSERRQKLLWLKLLREVHAYSLGIGQHLTLEIGAVIPKEWASDHADLAEHAKDGQFKPGQTEPDELFHAFPIDSKDYIRLMTPSGNAIPEQKLPLLPGLESLNALDFLSHASEWRWHDEYTSPIFDNPRYNVRRRLVLLALDWGDKHLVLETLTCLGWNHSADDREAIFRVY